MSYVDYLSALDEHRVATLPTGLLETLQKTVSRELSRRQAISPITFFNGWVQRDRRRKVHYAFWKLDARTPRLAGKITIVHENGTVQEKIITRVHITGCKKVLKHKLAEHGMVLLNDVQGGPEFSLDDSSSDDDWPGDSLPFPAVTKEQLDAELDEMMRIRS